MLGPYMKYAGIPSLAVVLMIDAGYLSLVCQARLVSMEKQHQKFPGFPD